MSRNLSQFIGIEQSTVRKGGYTFPLPTFYYKSLAFGISAFADRVALRRILPSPRLDPLRLPRGRTMVILVAFEHLDTDIGSFNEFIVAAPVARPGIKGFSGLPFGRRHMSPSLYIVHRAVDDDRAAVLYREVFGFPATRATVNIEHLAGKIRCHVSIADEIAALMEVPEKEGARAMDVRADCYSVRGDRLLRSGIIGKFQGIKTCLGYKTRLEKGSGNFLGNDLEEIKMGGTIAGCYIPHVVFAAVNPTESLPVGTV